MEVYGCFLVVIKPCLSATKSFFNWYSMGHFACNLRTETDYTIHLVLFLSLEEKFITSLWCGGLLAIQRGKVRGCLTLQTNFVLRHKIKSMIRWGMYTACTQILHQKQVIIKHGWFSMKEIFWNNWQCSKWRFSEEPCSYTEHELWSLVMCPIHSSVFRNLLTS